MAETERGRETETMTERGRDTETATERRNHHVLFMGDRLESELLRTAVHHTFTVSVRTFPQRIS